LAAENVAAPALEPDLRENEVSFHEGVDIVGFYAEDGVILKTFG